MNAQEATPLAASMTDRQRPPSFGYLHIASLGEANADTSVARPGEPKPQNAPASDHAGPWVGGYLIVCPLGRPLEFHCTAPVAASPAQAILYGDSLRPFILGEHLGGTLVGKARLTPEVLLVDDAAAEAAGRAGPLATVLLATQEGTKPPVAAAPIDALPTPAWLLSRGEAGGTQQVAEALRRLAESVDLAEPFDRIREAVAEASRGADEQPGADAVEPSPQPEAPHRDAA